MDCKYQVNNMCCNWNKYIKVYNYKVPSMVIKNGIPLKNLDCTKCDEIEIKKKFDALVDI